MEEISIPSTDGSEQMFDYGSRSGVRRIASDPIGVDKARPTGGKGHHDNAHHLAVRLGTAPSTIGDYARKSYRYLRIAIVAIVLALILGIFIEDWFGDGPSLNSISAYQWSDAGRFLSAP